MSFFKHHFTRNKYEYVLVSLLLLLFGQLFFPQRFESFFTPFFLIQNLAVGFLVFYENKWWRRYILFTLFLILGFEFIEFVRTDFFGEKVKAVFYIIYFLALSLKTFQYVFQQKKIDRGMIAAVFSGFMMLAIFGGLLFYFIESSAPNSFSNLGEEGEIYPNLQYFSFITTLTIGFGDIVPLTFVAKKATMLLGVAGNFYTVFVAGIVIGKFIKDK